MRERKCQAEVHVERCACQRCNKKVCGNCHRTNIDHFTPQCIAKRILHWSDHTMNSPANTQYLSRECHIEKDRTTPDRLHANFRQQRGGIITLQEVMRWAEESEYNH